MAINWDDEDWLKVGRKSPNQGGRQPHFTTSRLFTATTARRGAGARVHVDSHAPKAIFRMGYTQRRGIGVDSRTLHRNHLRAQANYIGSDKTLGPAEAFDKNGPVESIWQRVESWEDDTRYFRVSLNPLDHDKIQDWPRYVSECMEVFQHGSHRTFDPSGQGLHWHADGMRTDEDRAAGKEIDWVASVHRSTGRAHAHVLMRGTLGHEDLRIDSEAISEFWKIGCGVASMEHHVGLQFERNPEVEVEFARTVVRDYQTDHRALSKLSKQAGHDLEID
jgi:hypothetical protein